MREGGGWLWCCREEDRQEWRGEEEKNKTKNRWRWRLMRGRLYVSVMGKDQAVGSGELRGFS